MTCGFLPPPFFRELSSFCRCCISAFSYVQGPNTLSPSAKIAPGGLLTLQGWLVVSSSSGRAGCGGLPAGGKKLWEPRWTWGCVVWRGAVTSARAESVGACMSNLGLGSLLHAGKKLRDHQGFLFLEGDGKEGGLWSIWRTAECNSSRESCKNRWWRASEDEGWVARRRRQAQMP